MHQGVPLYRLRIADGSGYGPSSEADIGPKFQSGLACLPPLQRLGKQQPEPRTRAPVPVHECTPRSRKFAELPHRSGRSTVFRGSRCRGSPDGGIRHPAHSPGDRAASALDPRRCGALGLHRPDADLDPRGGSARRLDSGPRSGAAFSARIRPGASIEARLFAYQESACSSDPRGLVASRSVPARSSPV